MWAFGKASRWARLESSPCWGMVEGKFERMLSVIFKSLELSLKAVRDHGRHLDIRKAKKKKNSYGMFFS